MARKSLLISLLLLALAAGCTGQASEPPRPAIPTIHVEPTQLAALTATRISTALLTASRTPSPTIKPSPTWTPLPTKASALPLPTAVVTESLATVSQIPITASLNGTLVVWERSKLHFLKFSGSQFQTSVLQRSLFGAGVSPDQNWLLYNIYVGDSSDNIAWYIQDQDAKLQKRTILASTWRYFGWAGGDRLVFRKMIGGWDNYGIETQFNTPGMILNPFTGEQMLLPPADYPGVKDANKAFLRIDINGMIYDANMEYVAYPQWDEHAPGCFYALWNLKTKVLVGRVQIDGCGITGGPLWLADESGFLIASYEEWYQVNKDGATRQLTHFKEEPDDIPTIFIESHSADLSPNGRYLVFTIYFATLPGPDSRPILAVLDMETLKVTTYKIPTDDIWNFASKWSPDSRYLAVGSSYGTTIVDIFHHWQSPVLDSGSPFGWLK